MTSNRLLKSEVSSYNHKRDFREILMIEISRFNEPMNRMFLDFLINRYSDRYFFTIDISGNSKLDAYILAGCDNPQTLHIYSIAIRKEFEGKGWAKKLLFHVIREARNDCIKNIYLEVREDNDRAVNLYQKLGWVKFGQEEAYYIDGTSAIKMKLDLN